MYFFVGFSIVCTLAYMLAIRFTLKGWNATPEWKIPEDFTPTTSVSIIIVGRNEATALPFLLDALARQNYPENLFQCIFVDDHSEDDTLQIAKNHPFKNKLVISLGDYIEQEKITSFKKTAIETAIPLATGQLIITTDADCVMNENWLENLVSFYEEKIYKLIAAPVNFHQEKNILEKFQSLDFIGMMGVTAAGIQQQFMRMCNGANLAYEKDVFLEVNGFSGNEEKASGDDMFLLHKIAEKYPDGIGFLKQEKATVYTQAKPTISSFYQQRLRWATKNADYDDLRVLFINAIVFFTCFNFFTSIIFLVFFPKLLLINMLIILIGKGIADYFFLKKMSHFFQRKDLMKTFFISQFFHITYIFTIGMAANFIKQYEWKGRKVK